MKLDTHLNFDGDCQAAFEYYAKCLGGKITLMLTYGNSPMAAHVSPEEQGKILHATLEIGGQRLAGADIPAGRYGKPQGFSLLLDAETAEEADRAFGLLAEGGTSEMPLQETFWALRFGMLVDRYGTPWTIHCGKPA
jgi:PhnB protein